MPCEMHTVADAEALGELDELRNLAARAGHDQDDVALHAVQALEHNVRAALPHRHLGQQHDSLAGKLVPKTSERRHAGMKVRGREIWDVVKLRKQMRFPERGVVNEKIIVGNQFVEMAHAEARDSLQHRKRETVSKIFGRNRGVGPRHIPFHAMVHARLPAAKQPGEGKSEVMVVKMNPVRGLVDVPPQEEARPRPPTDEA